MEEKMARRKKIPLDQPGTFWVLVGIAFSAVPDFDYNEFVSKYPWLLMLVAAASKAGGFTVDVVKTIVPPDFQKNATPDEVMNLVDFMNKFSELMGWPSLPEMAGQSAPVDQSKQTTKPGGGKKKRPYKRRGKGKRPVGQTKKGNPLKKVAKWARKPAAGESRPRHSRAMRKSAALSLAIKNPPGRS
jgi:hypothetical protein